MDFKGQYRLAAGRWCYPLSVLDDHSRFALALDGFAVAAWQRRAGDPAGHLRAPGCTGGHPDGSRRALVESRQRSWPDRGRCLSNPPRSKPVYSGIAHPQTQGKVERFHRTLAAWLRHHGVPRTLADFQSAFLDFRLEYNTVRPHEALSLQTPAQRYRPSRKPYLADPPTGSTQPARRSCASRQRLHLPPGRLSFRLRSSARATCAPRALRRSHPGLLRHMLIRELNLATGAAARCFGHAPHSNGD